MRRTVCCLLLCLSAAASARAQPQQKEPIGRFVVDLRGSFARHKAEPSVATDLGVDPANLPPRTLGLVGGAHVYVLHSSKITLGLGGNVVFGRGSRSSTSSMRPASRWSRRRRRRRSAATFRPSRRRFR